MVKVGILGCGLQGLRRARAVKENGDDLIVVADVDKKRADSLAVQMECKASSDWRDVVSSAEIDVVIVCTPNSLHNQMSIAALKNGKHVLCEKPMGTSFDETKQIVEVAKEHNLTLKCGFNHRHHPGIGQIKKWFDEGAIGELLFMRCRYGTCGRAGYDKEWRANPAFSGGGELLDQGTHVLDLFNWFAGRFDEVTGFTPTAYWNTCVEDNAFALLKNTKGQVAMMHVSWTQWNNLFSFEVFGKEGYLKVEGLGGSYGVEKAIRGKRLFSEPFAEEVVDYRENDVSWLNEWREFTDALRNKRSPIGDGQDCLDVMRLVQAIYQSDLSKTTVKVQG
jgi:predicted dehydrogenase